MIKGDGRSWLLLLLLLQQQQLHQLLLRQLRLLCLRGKPLLWRHQLWQQLLLQQLLLRHERSPDRLARLRRDVLPRHLLASSERFRSALLRPLQGVLLGQSSALQLLLVIQRLCASLMLRKGALHREKHGAGGVSKRHPDQVLMPGLRSNLQQLLLWQLWQLQLWQLLLWQQLLLQLLQQLLWQLLLWQLLLLQLLLWTLLLWHLLLWQLLLWQLLLWQLLLWQLLLWQLLLWQLLLWQELLLISLKGRQLRLKLGHPLLLLLLLLLGLLVCRSPLLTLRDCGLEAFRLPTQASLRSDDGGERFQY